MRRKRGRDEKTNQLEKWIALLATVFAETIGHSLVASTRYEPDPPRVHRRLTQLV